MEVISSSAHVLQLQGTCMHTCTGRKLEKAAGKEEACFGAPGRVGRPGSRGCSFLFAGRVPTVGLTALCSQPGLLRPGGPRLFLLGGGECPRIEAVPVLPARGASVHSMGGHHQGARACARGSGTSI